MTQPKNKTAKKPTLTEVIAMHLTGRYTPAKVADMRSHAARLLEAAKNPKLTNARRTMRLTWAADLLSSADHYETIVRRAARLRKKYALTVEQVERLYKAAPGKLLKAAA